MSTRLDLIAGNIDYGFLLPALARLPTKIAYVLSDLRADVLFILRKAARKQGLRNLAIIFPDRDKSNLQMILRRSFRIQARDEMESYWYGGPLEQLQSLVRSTNLEVVQRAQARRKGVLLYTGHMGNHGIFLTLMGRLGIEMNLVLLNLVEVPLRPRAWIRFGNMRVSSIVDAVGKPALYTGQTSYFALRRLLAAGEPLMMAIDVLPSLTKRLVEVDFFSRRARFPEGLARLYLDTQARVLLWSVHESQDGRYDFVIDDVSPQLEHGESTQQITQIMVTALEKRILQDPANWSQWPSMHEFFVSPLS